MSVSSNPRTPRPRPRAVRATPAGRATPRNPPSKRKNRRKRRNTSSVRYSDNRQLISENSSVSRYVPGRGTFVGGKGLFTSSPTDLKNPLHAYLACLVNPERYIARYPDSYTRKSALFRSIAEYSVPLNFNADLNQGLFSLCTQPKLGKLNAPTPNPFNFQIAMADVDAADWNSVDWSSPSNYQSATIDGDCRLDANYYQMQGSPAGLSSWTASATTGGGTLFGDNLLFGAAPGANNFGPQVTPADDTTVPANSNRLDFPQGVWLLSVDITIAASAGAALFPWNLIVNPTNATVTLLSSTKSTQAASTTITFHYSAIITATSATSSYLQFQLQNSSPAAVPAAGVTTYGLALVAAPVQIGPTTTGFIERLRPVAQSTLVTYMGPELLDGGQITMAYVDPDYVASNYFGNPTQGGNGQSFNRLATTNSGAYNGKLTHGAYGWWSPAVDDDMNFQTVSAQADYKFPSIICSGSFTPASSISGSNGTNGMLRVRVCTVFEFWTESTAWQTEKCDGSMAIIDAVNSILSNQPHVMPNATHKSWIGSMMSGVSGFVKDNPSLFKALGTAAKMAVPLLLA